jgi:hypothetical protein
MSWFGKLVHLVIDYDVRGPIIRYFTNLGKLEDGRIQRQMCRQKKNH